MEGNSSSSHGTSWADQWDNGPDPVAVEAKHNHGGGAAKYKQKAGEGLEKTKAAAKSGFSKLKQGTSHGLTWIKSKYQNTSTKS